MADLELVSRLAAGDHNLAVFSTAGLDGSVHASVVSAGVIDDPIDGHAGVGAVVGGATRKLTLLRQSGTASVVFKNGFEWAAVTRPGAAHRARGRDGVRARRTRTPPDGLPGGRWDPRGLGRVRPGHGGGLSLRRLRRGGENHGQPDRLTRHNIRPPPAAGEGWRRTTI